MYNPFLTLKIPAQFDINIEQVEANYHELMRENHPDRIANSSSKDKREMLQRSTKINDAYNTVLDEIERAQALIDLAVSQKLFDVEAIVNTDNEFIMQQFNLRSKVDKLKHNFDFEVYQEIDESCKQLRCATLKLLSSAFAECDYGLAQKLVHRLQFIRKLATELSDLEV